MKNIFKSFFVIAAAALTLAGCQKKEIEQPQEIEGDYMYTFTIDDETRAVIGDNNIEWVAGDQVGMYVGTYKGYAKVDVTTTPKMVVLYSTTAIPAGTMAYAYAPYDPENKNNEPARTKILVNNIQSGAEVSAMPLAGLPFEVEEEVAANNQDGNGQIKFMNLGSLINFKIFSTNEEFQSETIQSIQFESTKAIAGVGYIDLTAVDMNDESTLVLDMETEENSVKVVEEMAVAADKEAADPIKMVILPGTFEGTLTVVTDVATYTKAIPEREFARSHTRTFGLDLAKAERTEGVVEVVKTLPYEEAFTANQGDFKIENVTLPDDVTTLWAFDASYGAKVTAYINKVNYASETWLVSPQIDLTDVAAAELSFEQCVNKYLAAGDATLWIKKVGDENYTQIENTYPATGSNGWSSFAAKTINLSDYVGNKIVFAFKYISTTDAAGTWEIKNFSAHVVKADPELSFATTEFTANVGEDFTAPTLTNPHNLTVAYASSDDEIAQVNETSGAVTVGNKAGIVTITASFEGNDDYNAGSASYIIRVTDPEATSVTDVINRAFTGLAAGANYADWSGKVGTSGAIYAGLSAAYDQNSSDAIQLRSKNNNSGIVTTTSGGHATKVTVAWNSNTVAGRTLDVYGKSSAYSSAADLYDSNKQGTLLGSLVKGTSSSLIISGDYTFIGLRSNDGAMYLDEIQIEWSASAPVVTTYAINLGDVENGTIEANLDEAAAGAIVTLTATPAEGYAFDEWSVVDDDDNEIAVTNDQFTMPASDVYVSATFIPVQTGSTTVVKTMNQIVSENNYTVSAGSDVTLYTSFMLDDIVTVSTSGDPNCGSFWGSTTYDWRLYQAQNGDITISVPSEKELVSVKITYNSNKSGTLMSGTTVIASATLQNVSGTSVTYTVGNTGSATNGQVRVTEIEVTYN